MKQLFYFILILLFACNNEKTESERYLTTKSNFTYKIIRSPKPGDSIQKGDIVKIHLQQFMDDSLMNDTRNGTPVYVKIDSTLREFDFTEIIPFMNVGDSAICLFPTNEILKRATLETYPPFFLEKGENIRVFFKVVRKFKSDSLGQRDFISEEKRNDSIAALKEKSGYETSAHVFDSLIKAVKGPLVKLKNGVYVQVLEKGKGAKIKPGDSVAVTYKGTLANGSVFEKNTIQQPFVIMAGEGYLIKGLDSAICTLNFGDKAKIHVPAKLAYGADKAGDKILAFSNLVFEVEVRSR
jgi:FKBP-type peptidyl-prolyl cis-trans isomerase FkpA